MSDALEACYHNDQAGKAQNKKNAYKVFFFFLILRASGMMLSLQIKRCGFTLQLGPPEFIKLGRRRRVRIFTIFGIPDLPISHGLFP